MQKDFDQWNTKKKQTHAKGKRPFFHIREIWYCKLGVNIGFEQDGAGNDFLRPVLIFRKFNNEVFWGIPLTRTHKKSPFYFSFTLQTRGVRGEGSVAILSQIRIIDASRLSHKIGEIRIVDFAELKKSFTALLP